MIDHPLAELFPLMGDDDLASLAADISEHGLRAPITVLDGKILDGRNRFRACGIAKVEPKTRDFKGDDPLEFVLSVNLHRRHLNESQRAMIAAKIANMHSGKPLNSANLPNKTNTTQTEAAKRLNVSTRSVTSARAVLKNPVQSKAVESGHQTVNGAVKQIAAAKAAKEVKRDSTGYAIPDKILPLWNRREEIVEIQNAIAKARRMVKDAYEKLPDPLWQPVNLQAVLAELQNTKRDLDMAFPYAVCPTCQGMAADKCASCKGRGFLPKHTFDVTTPEELKRIRAKSCVL